MCYLSIFISPTSGKGLSKAQEFVVNMHCCFLHELCGKPNSIYSLRNSILLLPYLMMYYIVFVLFLLSFWCLKKNQTTPRPSEHPPVMGGKVTKRLDGIKRLQIQNFFMAFKQVPRCR